MPGAGAGELAVQGVEKGLMVLGAGAGAVSWMCTWWRQVAGAGAVLGAGAGAVVLVLGAVSWLCAWWRVLGAA